VPRAGNPQDVLKAIADRHKLEPAGEPSLQNSIELARSSMKYSPVSISIQTDSHQLIAIFQRILHAKF
jgi:hypothetical protein